MTKDEAYADFAAMTPEEYQAQKEDAAKWRRRYKPHGRGPAEYSDADILSLERQCVRKFDKERGRAPLQRELHVFIADNTNLKVNSARNRLIAARKKAGVRK